MKDAQYLHDFQDTYRPFYFILSILLILSRYFCSYKGCLKRLRIHPQFQPFGLCLFVRVGTLEKGIRADSHRARVHFYNFHSSVSEKNCQMLLMMSRVNCGGIAVLGEACLILI